MDTNQKVGLAAAISLVVAFLWRSLCSACLACVDAFWRYIWRRNADWVRGEIVTALEIQLAQLATLPQLAMSMESIARSMETQAVTQGRHGRRIAAIKTAVEFLRDEVVPERRRRISRRSDDPLPTDFRPE